MKKITTYLLEFIGEQNLGFSKRNRIIYYSTVIIFLSSIIFTMFEHEYLINTIGCKEIILKYGFLGIFVSVVILIYLYFSSNQIILSAKKYNLIVGLTVGLSLFGPSAYSVINRSFPQSGFSYLNKKIIKKTSGSGRNKFYNIHLKIGDRVEYFRIHRKFWDKLYVGQIVELKVKKGCLNNLYLTRVREIFYKIHFHGTNFKKESNLKLFLNGVFYKNLKVNKSFDLKFNYENEIYIGLYEDKKINSEWDFHFIMNAKINSYNIELTRSSVKKRKNIFFLKDGRFKKKEIYLN